MKLSVIKAENSTNKRCSPLLKKVMMLIGAMGSEFVLRNLYLEGDIHRLTSRNVYQQLSQSDHRKLGQGMTKGNVHLL